MTDTVDPDPALAVGRVLEATDSVTTALVQRFRATLGSHLAPRRESEDAPLGLHWCLAPEAASPDGVGADGHVARGRFLPETPGLPRRMWAGGEIEFLAPIRIGDPVRKRSRIASVSRKEGRTGPLVFVAVEHAVETPRGLAVRERQDLVFRAAEVEATASPATNRSPEIRPDPAFQAELATDALLLFRYSALTFNGHRIHYDAPYATGVEGYAGLVVQGSLQATLLLHAAVRLDAAGRPPTRFAYRGLQALAVGTPARVLAWLPATDGSMRAEVRENGSGRTTMAATATW